LIGAHMQLFGLQINSGHQIANEKVVLIVVGWFFIPQCSTEGTNFQRLHWHLHCPLAWCQQSASQG
jgi:hypothetical protein